MKRFQFKNNLSIVTGRHTIKAGGEWLHSNNVQVFRGFFKGKYIFDSVTGFLRYASPAAPGGFGPFTVGCSNGVLRHRAGGLPGGHDADRRAAALLPAEQQPGRHRARRGRAHPTSTTRSSRSSSRTSGSSGRGLTLDYGLRWDAQLMPETVDPTTTAYAHLLNDPRFPSDGTIPDQWKQFQPRVGFAWDVEARTARRWCAAAPASTTPGRTCSARSDR